MFFESYRKKRYMNKLITRRDMEFKIKRLEAEVESLSSNITHMSRKLMACTNDRDLYYKKSQEQSIEIRLLTDEIDKVNGLLNDNREALNAAQRKTNQ